MIAKRFEGRVAIVTGAASGIGRATAELLLRQGARVALFDHIPNPREVVPTNTECMTQELDVVDEVAVVHAINAVLARWGRIDVLVNNAGLSSTKGSALEQERDEWERVMAVNLIGPMQMTKHAGPALIASGRGAIVNTASVAGIRAGAGGNAYSASKAGLISFTQTAACDFGAYNVRVNAVCPGLTETGMTRAVFDTARAAGKGDRLGARCELRRYGRPEEIAAVIAFLASDEASYITGQALAVDGGNTASLNLPGMKV